MKRNLNEMKSHSDSIDYNKSNLVCSSVNKIYDSIVIGGGAAGLFYAAMPKPNGFQGLILESTGKVGTKLLMSGGGHCNITHSGPIKDFIPCYGESGKTIRKILYSHSNLELIEYLETGGIPCIEEEDGRIFPKSKNASDIRNILKSKAEENGFKINLNSKVTSISKAANGLWKIECGEQADSERGDTFFLGRNIVIATGGCSYPKTGSDGNMFDVIKRDLNVEVTPLTPSLSPIEIKDHPYTELSGLSMDVKVKYKTKSSLGSLLFTHKGLSGPVVINMSGDIEVGDEIIINYLPGYRFDEVFHALQEALDGSKSNLATIIEKTFGLTKSFSRIIASRAGNSTKKAARLLTEDRLIVKDTGSFANAMVTRGGVSLSEIDLTSMELKSHRGVFVIGEALDVDGISGGYNLQFAYSSAATASDNTTMNQEVSI